MTWINKIIDTIKKFKPQIIEVIRRTLGPILLMFGFGTEHDWDQLIDSLFKLSAAIITVLSYIDVIVAAVKTIWTSMKDLWKSILKIFTKRDN